MGSILVGVDGSDGSRAALRWAAYVAAARGASLHAIGAWHYPASAVSPGAPATLPSPAEMDDRTLDTVRSIVREELGADADTVTVDAGRGPAAAVLIGAAARIEADLLVLGARGLGGFGGLLLGSVSQQCVEHAPCPTVVLRGDHRLQDGPIVIGLDGSDDSERALRWTIELAEATGSTIVAVHAPDVADETVTLETVRETLERWCSPIAERGVPFDARIEAGDARTAIGRAADATDAALVVVGTRGLGAVRGLLLGSVAGYVVRHAQRPIAVVPRPTA